MKEELKEITSHGVMNKKGGKKRAENQRRRKRGRKCGSENLSVGEGDMYDQGMKAGKNVIGKCNTWDMDIALRLLRIGKGK